MALLKFECCLNHIGELASKTARIVGASYADNEFERFEHTFSQTERKLGYWTMLGNEAFCMTVKLEQGQSYYPVEIEGRGESFVQARNLLLEHFMQYNPYGQKRA